MRRRGALKGDMILGGSRTELDGGYAEAYNNRGIVSEIRGEDAAAKADYKRAEEPNLKP